MTAIVPNWANISLPKITKNIYNDRKLSLSPSQVNIFHKTHNIKVTGVDPNEQLPNPIERHADLDLPNSVSSLFPPDRLVDPMHAQLWPIIMSGRNTIVQARASRERTQSFALPAVLHVIRQSNLKGVLSSSSSSHVNAPIVLILCPTNGHVPDVLLHIQLICNALPVVSCGSRIVASSDGTKVLNVDHIFVTTPLCAHGMLAARALDMRRCSLVIVDDVDICMYQRQGPIVDNVLLQIRPDRQMVFVSHLWLTDGKRLHKMHAIKWTTVMVGEFIQDVSLITKVNLQVIREPFVHNVVYIIEDIYAKCGKNPWKILIFARETIAMCLKLRMREFGLPCEALLSSYDADLRRRTLNDFQNGRKPILVAPDYPIIGLDVCGIETIFILDQTPDAYPYRLSYMSDIKWGGTAYYCVPYNKKEMKNVGDAVFWLRRAGQKCSKEIEDLVKSYNIPVEDPSFSFARKVTTRQDKKKMEIFAEIAPKRQRIVQDVVPGVSEDKKWHGADEILQKILNASKTNDSSSVV